MSDKSLDEQLMAHSENIYKLACAAGKLEAERDALRETILQFKENPISKNKFKMFDLLEER